MSNRPPTVSNSFTSRQIEITEKLIIDGVQFKAVTPNNVFIGAKLFNVFNPGCTKCRIAVSAGKITCSFKTDF